MSRNSSNKNLIPESNSRFIYVEVPIAELENATRDIIRLALEKAAQDPITSPAAAIGVSPGSFLFGTSAWYILLGALSLSAIGSVLTAANLRDRISSAIERVRQQRLYGGIPKEEWTTLRKEINFPEVKKGEDKQTVSVPLPVELFARFGQAVGEYIPSTTIQYAAAATALSLMYWVGCWAGGVIGDLVANNNLTKDVSQDVAESKRRMLNSLKRLIKAKIPEPFSQAVAIDNTGGIQLIKQSGLEKTADAWDFVKSIPPIVYGAIYLVGFLAGVITYPSLEKAHPASPDPEQAAVAKALSILSGSPYPVEIDPAEIKEIFKYQQPEKEVGRSAIPMGLAKAAPESDKKRQRSGISLMY